MASVQFWTEAQETKIILTKAQIKSAFVSGRIIYYNLINKKNKLKKIQNILIINIKNKIHKFILINHFDFI